jgi:hypothetical protein
MTLAVLTTVYPMAAPFLDDFRLSLVAQDDQDFILYVLDDQLGGMDSRFARFTGRMKIVPGHGSPGAIRTQGIRTLADDGITEVVFADCDDCLSSNRVSVARELLKQHAVVANELFAFGNGIDGSKAMLGPILHDGQRIDVGDLLHGNVLGLSNTACRVASLLPHVGAIDGNLLAYDWALYTRVLHAGTQAVFTLRASTAYRQHAGTIAGLQRNDARTLMQCVRVKASHYRALVDLGGPFPELSSAFGCLRERLERDPLALSRYVAACEAGAPPPHEAWWSAARLPASLPYGEAS